MKCNHNSDTNDRNKDDTSEKFSEEIGLNNNSENDSYRDDLSEKNRKTWNTIAIVQQIIATEKI